MTSDADYEIDETDFSIEGLPRRVVASEPDPTDLEQVLHQFTETVRSGRLPSVDSYVQRYPALADQLRELLPVVASMERWKRWREVPGPNGDVDLERLQSLGECEIVREIGRGGMGIVFEAYERAVSLADESVLREDFKEGLRAMAGKRTPQFDALDPALGYIEMGDPAAGC